MLRQEHLPKLLGDQYVPEARYCMTESQSIGRGGRMPSRRTARAIRRLVPLGLNGRWKALGEFSDPEVQSTRTYTIYQWVPTPEEPRHDEPQPVNSPV